MRLAKKIEETEINFRQLVISSKFVKREIIILLKKIATNEIHIENVVKEDITLKSDQPIGEIIDQIKNSNPNITQIRFKESFQNHHTFEITIGSNTQNLTKQDAELIRTNILNNFKE